MWIWTLLSQEFRWLWRIPQSLCKSSTAWKLRRSLRRLRSYIKTYGLLHGGSSWVLLLPKLYTNVWCQWLVQLPYIYIQMYSSGRTYDIPQNNPKMAFALDHPSYDQKSDRGLEPPTSTSPTLSIAHSCSFILTSLLDKTPCFGIVRCVEIEGEHVWLLNPQVERSSLVVEDQARQPWTRPRLQTEP